MSLFTLLNGSRARPAGYTVAPATLFSTRQSFRQSFGIIKNAAELLRLSAVLLVLVGLNANAQTTYDWLITAPDGNFKQGGAGARWNPGGLIDEPPFGIIQFNNNNQTTMTNNVAGTWSQFKINFGSSATTVRTIAGNSIQFFDFSGTWPFIQNQSTATHTINFPILIGSTNTFNLELIANAGNINFGTGATFNNQGKGIYVYGNNAAVDATNRSIRLGDVVSGTGFLNVSQFGVAKLNATNVYTGQTQIDNGELWIESSGSIATGSGIFVGNGGQQTNIAKFWISNAAGGATVTNAITVNNGNANTRYLGGLNTSGTHTFSGNITNNSTTGGLNLSALTAGGTTVFSGSISGTSALTTEGAGTLILSGVSANTYTGTTTTNGTLLVLNKTAGIVAIPAATTIAAGATIRTDAANQWGGTPPLVTINGNGVLNLNSNNQKIALASASSTASVTLGTATLNIDNTGTDVYAGTISGTGGLTKTSAGTEILQNSANSFTGTTTITGGELKLNPSANATYASQMVLNGGTLGTTGIASTRTWTSSSTVAVNANSTIALQSATAHNLTFANSSAVGWTSGAILTITGWTGSYNGTTGMGGKIFVGTSVNALTNQQVSQIYFNNGTNNFTATLLSTGELVPSSNIVIPWTMTTGANAWYTNTHWTPNTTSAAWTTTNIAQFNNAGTASVAGINLTTSSLSIGAIDVTDQRATNNLTVNASTGTGTLTLNGASLANTANTILRNNSGKLLTLTDANLTIPIGNTINNVVLVDGTGGVTIGSVISGTSNKNLTKSGLGSGVLTLSGANTYGGSTTINGGTLSCAIASALPSTTDVTIANTSGANLSLGTFSQTINSLAGGGTTGGNVSVTSGGVLTVNGTINTTYSGVISGTGAFVKDGASVLTLANAANVHTGATTLTTGELRLNPASNATYASQVILNGGTLGTTGISSGRTWTSTSTLNLNASSSITLDAVAHTLIFAASNGVTWNGTALTINGWTGTAGSSGTGGKIFIGASVSGLVAGQLSKITFTGFGAATILSSGEIVPTAAVAYNWNGTTDALWGTATNWTPNGIPGLIDNIIISSPGGFTLTINTTQNINNVSLTGTGTFNLLGSGVLNVYGNFTSTSSAALPLNANCASTINFASTVVQVIPALSYGNLNTTGGLRTLASSSTIKVCGNYTPSASATTVTGSTVDFNGTTAQAINTNAASFNNLIISNAGALAFPTAGSINVTANTAVTVANGATLTVNTNGRLDMGANTLTLTGSTSIVNGYLRTAGTITQTSGSLTVSATGTYEHNQNGGTIPTATWDNTAPGSNCAVIGWVGSTSSPGGLTPLGGFSNFTWNCPSQTNTPNLSGGLSLINRNFSVLSTGSAVNGLRLFNSGASSISIGGNLNIVSNTTNTILDINNASGGTLNIGGNLTISQPSFLAKIQNNTGTSASNIVFNGSTTQVITLDAPSQIVTAASYTQSNPNGISITGTLPVNNNASFTMAAGSVTGVVTYGTGTTLTYINTTASNQSGEWPAASGPVNLTINGSGGTTLQGSRTVNGLLTLTNGVLTLGTNDLTISNVGAASISGGSSSTFINTNNTGQLIRTLATSGFPINYAFPVGLSTNFTPAAFNFTANSNSRDLGVRVINGTHPNMAPNPPVFVQNRYWQTTLGTISGGYTYTPTFTFIDPADVSGSPSSGLRLNRWTGAVWSELQTMPTTPPNLIGVSLTESTGNLSGSGWSGRAVRTPVTYTWTGSSGGAWTTASNWTSAGGPGVPTNGDAVIFNHGDSRAVLNTLTGITLSSMNFLGGGITSLFASSPGTLNISGGTSPQLNVASGTSVLIDGTNALSVAILSGSIGSISGNFGLQASSGSVSHSLLPPPAASGIVFQTGSYFSSGKAGSTNYTGNPFGSSGTNDAVEFKIGSVFEQFDGGSPFGATSSDKITKFFAGSLFKYSYVQAAQTPSISSRTFANFEYNASGTRISSLPATAFSMDNLTVTQGTWTLNNTITGNASIKGNITVSSGASVSFNPTNPGVYDLIGSAAQTISGAGTFTLGANASVNVINSIGVSLLKNMTDTGAITVANGGIFNATAENTITGTGSFTVLTGGTLGIGSVNGITSVGIGNIQTTARSYSSLANYTYMAAANQVTGNFTTAPTANTLNILTIANTGTNPTDVVTLTNNNTTANTLNLATGRFAADTNQTLKIAADGSVNGNGNLTNLGNQYVTDAAGGTIEFLSNGAVRGTPTLYNITIGNSGVGVDFANNATIYNNLLINNLGSVNPNAPKYAVGSTLIYNPGGTYNRSKEWGQVTPLDAGYPHHVLVQNGTTLNLGMPAPPNLEIGGNLTIGTATSGTNIVNMNALSIPLKVLGNLVIGDPATSGNRLYLSTSIGGDLALSGSFIRYRNDNYFDYGTRAIFFKGASNASVFAPIQNFYKILMQKTGSGDLTLNCPVTIENTADFSSGIINTTSTNLLTLIPSATTIGASVNSFVNGPVAKETDATNTPVGTYEFMFPVGKTAPSTQYKPCNVLPVSTSGTTTYTGEFFPANPAAVYPVPFIGTLVYIYKPYYWKVDRGAGQTGKARVALDYNPAGIATTDWGSSSPTFASPPSIPPATNVAVVKDFGTNWNFTKSAGNFNDRGPMYEARYYTTTGKIYTDTLDAFSPFTFGFDYSVILPVNLLSFTGRLIGADAKLEWNLADAKDLAGFELEYSRNGRVYSRLASLPSDGSTNYNYLHPQLPAGTHFYRLQVKDKSGKTYYSQVVLLTVGALRTQVVGLAQNPVTNQLTPIIISAASQQASATITDAAGRLLSRHQTSLMVGTNQWQIPAVGILSQGVYFVRITTADGVEAVLRFLKK